MSTPNTTMDSSDEVEKEIISTDNDEKVGISVEEVTTSLSTTMTTDIQTSGNNNNNDQTMTSIIDNESSSNNNNKEEDDNNNTKNNNEQNEGVFKYTGKEWLNDKEKKNITKVIVEDGVETIPKECFEDCERLETVQLPSSLISIEEYAFFNCEKLKEIIIPEGVRIIPEDCFKYCELLETVQLPSSLISIEEEAFLGCKKLKAIIIPIGVRIIRVGAFMQCESLVDITLPTTITTIEDNAFYKCRSLKEIILPNNINKIGQYAFSNCASLRQIKLPPSMDSIQEAAFEDCRMLQEILLPTKLKSIGQRAFRRCSSIEEITIPSSVDSIKGGTFGDCVLLKKVVLPQRLGSIEEDAFEGCWKLEGINITDQIKSIDSSAFNGCVNLPYDTINWPSSMKEEINNNILNSIRDNPWLPSKLKALRENIVLKEGPGPAFEFGGKTQRGWGPEWWAISRQQLEHFKTHPAYKYLTMRQFVSLVLERITDGLEIGYALLINQKMPLKARIMISHAWDEPLHEFVENILASGEEGPFWICSTGIYQNNDSAKGVTISEQIGPSPEHGPFATVLQVVDRMLAVITTQCNIYTRLWCVYELFIASKFDVSVTLRPFINDRHLEMGWLEYDVCIANIGERIHSETARCGNPNNPPNDDEIAIRNTIEASEKKFRSVDEAVELIRLIYLLHYPTDKIKHYVTSARDKLKDAIETVLSRLPLLRDRMKKYDEFVQEQLSIHQGYSIMERPEDIDERDWDDDGNRTGNYIINFHFIVSDSSPEKIDVFDAWIKYMIEIVKGEKN